MIKRKNKQKSPSLSKNKQMIKHVPKRRSLKGFFTANVSRGPPHGARTMKLGLYTRAREDPGRVDATPRLYSRRPEFLPTVRWRRSFCARAKASFLRYARAILMVIRAQPRHQLSSRAAHWPVKSYSSTVIARWSSRESLMSLLCLMLFQYA